MIDMLDVDYPADTGCNHCAVSYNLSIPQSNEPFLDTSEGIQLHSSDERYFIVAIDRNTKQGQVLFAEYLGSHSIGFKYVMGMFEGVEEYSFIINARDWSKVLHSGFISRQNWLLYLWSFGHGYAKYGLNARKASMISLKTGVILDKGVLVPINKDYLKPDENWTYDVEADQYWVIRNPLTGK